jgi:hypothetical protein
MEPGTRVGSEAEGRVGGRAGGRGARVQRVGGPAGRALGRVGSGERWMGIGIQRWYENWKHQLRVGCTMTTVDD